MPSTLKCVTEAHLLLKIIKHEKQQNSCIIHDLSSAEYVNIRYETKYGEPISTHVWHIFDK